MFSGSCFHKKKKLLAGVQPQCFWFSSWSLTSSIKNRNLVCHMNIPLGSISHNMLFVFSHLTHGHSRIFSFSCFTVSGFFLSVSFPLSYWYFSIYFNRISISFRFLYLCILYFHLFLLWEVSLLFCLLSHSLVSLCLCSSLQYVEDYGISVGKVMCFI